MKIGTKRPLVISISVGLILTGILTGCGAAGQREAVEPSGETKEAVETVGITFVDQLEVEEPARVTIQEQMKIEEEPEEADYRDVMAALLSDMYGDYREEGGEIAFVPDGALIDGIYNENIYDGICMYALAAGVSFSYYGVEGESLQDYRDALVHAVDNQARIIVCAGENFQKAVYELQNEYPQISFLLIDGVPEDESGEAADVADNVHCVTFQEEQAGYLAGYMAVMEGYRRFGFIGGVESAPVIRYGYGYLQGIDDAAGSMAIEDVSVKYWYAGTYEPGQEILDKASAWYEDGTEVIFACGAACMNL